MSLEQTIIDNTAALNRVAALLQAGAVAIPQAAAPVAAPAVAAMPAPPTFTAAQPLPPVGPSSAAAFMSPTGAPFTDPQGLMNYTMAAYQEMGATKGAAIQQVLASLGHANMNDVKPEQYAQFYAGVEALKRG
jgi:hypothetical protein